MQRHVGLDAKGQKSLYINNSSILAPKYNEFWDKLILVIISSNKDKKNGGRFTIVIKAWDKSRPNKDKKELMAILQLW